MNMAKIFACRDVGVYCPYVAHGETEEELMTAHNGYLGMTNLPLTTDVMILQIHRDLPKTSCRVTDIGVAEATPQIQAGSVEGLVDEGRW